MSDWILAFYIIGIILNTIATVGICYMITKIYIKMFHDPNPYVVVAPPPSV